MKKYILIIIAIISIPTSVIPQSTIKVGTLPGEFGVTPTGAAMYTIPIEIPACRAGMEPELAFVYNSQSGTNIMGEGWSVTGFSSIVRANKNMYYNKMIKTIDFVDDEFLLDGSHLIKINENESEVEYRTEIDQFSKIIFYKPSLEDMYGHFLVYHKSGTIAEYGYNHNSLHIFEDEVPGNNPAIAWHINKLYDRKGNYITYKYDQDPNSGELHPLFIYYTGYQSNNLRTTGSYEVAFFYESYSDSSQSIIFNHYKVGNEFYPYKIQNTKRLKAVEISYNSSAIKRYDLTYYPYEDNMSSTSKDFLRAVKLSIPYSSEELNETKFLWSFYNPIFNDRFLEEYTNRRLSLCKVLTLNLQGTNKESYAVYRDPVTIGLTSNVQTGNAVISIEHKEIPVNGNLQDPQMSAIDFDLNGDDELIFLDNEGIHIYDYIDGEFVNVYNRSFSGKFRVGDFNGDQVPDILLMDDYGRLLIGTYTGTGYISYNLDSHLLSFIDKFETVCDINGDNVLDIVLKDNNFYYYDIISFSQTNGFVTKGHCNISTEHIGIQVNFCDINGDTKTDAVYFKNGRKHIMFSHGYDFISKPEYFEEMTNIPTVIQDLNNDGRADFLFVQFGVTNTTLIIYYTLPNGVSTTRRSYEIEFSTDQFVSNFELSTGDLDGNGIRDFLFGFYEDIPPIEPNPPYYRFSLNLFYSETINQSGITEIIDGQNVSTRIEYKCNTLTKFETAFPVCKSKQKAPVVEESYIIGSEVPGGETLKKWNRKTYQYSKPLEHVTGKGFLGFMERSITSYENTSQSNDAVVVHNSDLLFNEDNYIYMYPYISETTVGGITISSTINTFDIIKTHGENSLCFLPVITQSSTKTWESDAEHTYKGIQIANQSIENIDEFGNSKKSEIIADEVATEPALANSWKKTYITSYDNLESEWLIYRPTCSIVNSYHKAEDISIPENEQSVINYKYYDAVIQPASFIEFTEVIPNGNSSLKLETWYTYDIFGNVTSETLKALIDGENKEKRIEYEYNDNMVYEGRFLTSETIKSNTPEQDIIKRYDYYLSSGLLKTTSFDDKNNLVSTIQYDKFGKIYKVVNPDLTSKEVNYKWVSDGHCEITPPDSSLYYSLTFKTNSSEAKWNKEFIFYDKYNRIICTVNVGLKGDKNAVHYKYDGLGRLYQTSEPYNYNTGPVVYNTISYDLLGRIVRETMSTGTIINTIYKGRKTRITNENSNMWTESTINAIGLIDITSEPSGGNVDYKYDPNGRVRFIYSQDSPTSIEYDDAGNAIKVVDPDAGIIFNTYNAFGELTTKTYDNLSQFVYKYDVFGRLETIDNTTNNETTRYYYVQNKNINGFGKIEKIEKKGSDGIMSTTYLYDNLNRLSTRSESIDGKLLSFTTEYDDGSGEISSYKFPSGLKLLYSYDDFGYLNEIKHEASGKKLWVSLDANPQGQITGMMYGTNMIVNNEFDTQGYLKRISTTKLTKGIEELIQDLRFTFDSSTDNLLNRTDEIRHLTETFTYDEELKSRLESWEVGVEKYNIQYESNGNIKLKSDVTSSNGIYNYNSNKIHQVVEVTNPTPEYLRDVKVQNITYTAFNKVNTISQKIGQLDVDLKFTYGTDFNRIKTVLSTRGTPLETRYYFGDYETKKSGTSTEQQLHYLYAPNGLFAIVEKDASTENLYYILKDHQDSYNQVTDEAGNTIELLSFDPWGRRRDPLTWSYTNAPSSSKFSRGYTGHEHLDNFGLINMNGRLYDPKLGRFLSPDPFLQNASSVQGHNRYSYVINNPLLYTDPSGYKASPVPCRKEYRDYFTNYTNFGRRGGSLSSTYWANSVRNAESNWAVMSQSTFDNMYGTGQYEKVGNQIRLDLAIRNAAPGDYTTYRWWSPVSGDEVYREPVEGGVNIYYDGTWVENKERDTQVGGLGWEPIIGTAGAIAGEMYYSKTYGTWMGKNFKMYQQTWFGNGFTGGKLKFAKKVSTRIKVGGYALGIWNAYKIDKQNRAGQITDLQMYMEQGSNLITTVGGLYGIAWCLGWELGRAVTNMEWYQEAKFNFWYNRWESQVGPPSQSNEALWYNFYQNYNP